MFVQTVKSQIYQMCCGFFYTCPLQSSDICIQKHPQLTIFGHRTSCYTYQDRSSLETWLWLASVWTGLRQPTGFINKYNMNIVTWIYLVMNWWVIERLDAGAQSDRDNRLFYSWSLNDHRVKGQTCNNKWGETVSDCWVYHIKLFQPEVKQEKWVFDSINEEQQTDEWSFVKRPNATWPLRNWSPAPKSKGDTERLLLLYAAQANCHVTPWNHLVFL